MRYASENMFITSSLQPTELFNLDYLSDFENARRRQVFPRLSSAEQSHDHKLDFLYSETVTD